MTSSNLSKTIRIDIAPHLLAGAGTPAPEASVPKAVPETPPKSPEPSHAAVLSKEADFHELFQSIYDGTLITDLKGNIVDANVRALEFLGYTLSELRDKTVVRTISGSDESLVSMVLKNLESDRFTLIQAYCVRKDGSFFPAEIAVNRLSLSPGDYLFFFVRDVTIRKRHEDRILKLQKSLSDRVQELEQALARIEKLEGLLPICSYCKKIRNKGEAWDDVERYITNHSAAEFTHSICPTCYQKYVEPGLDPE